MNTSASEHTERRAHPRIPVQFGGDVTVRYLHSESCRIKDYGAGGMYIECESISANTLDPSDNIREGDAVGLHFKLEQDGVPRSFRLRARVARVFDGAMGVAFYNPHEATMKAINALLNYAPSVETPEPEEKTGFSAPKNQDQIKKAVRAFVADQMQQTFQTLFVRFNDHLIHKASTAQTNQEQGDFFNGITVIKSKRAALEKNFLEKIVYEFDHTGEFKPRAESKSNAEAATELTMIDKDEFEDWLVIQDVISKTEARYETDLNDLTGRLYRLTLKPINNSLNPVGPAVYFQTWAESLEALGLQHNVLLALFKVLGEHASSKVGEIIAATNKLLTSHGILPVKTPEMVKRGVSLPTTPNAPAANQPQPESAQPDAAPATSGASQQSNPIPQGAQQTPQETPQPAAAQGQPAPTGAAPTTGNVVSLPTMEAGTIGSAPPTVFTSSGHAYSTLQNLQSLRRSTLDYHPATAAEPIDPNSPTYDSNEVVSVLSILQQEYEAASKDGKTSNLREWVLESLKQKRAPNDVKKQISDKQSDAIDVIERLFESMLSSRAIPNSIKPCIRRMEVPILKVVLKDEAFFQDKKHPARQVLNQLAKLAKTLSAKAGALNKPVEKTLNEVTKRLLDEFEQDVGIFNEVRDVLDKLVKRQEKVYRQNIERVTQNYEGQQKVRQARRQVLDEINQRVAGNAVPRVILSLLYHGWRDLLVVTHIRKGMDSHEWQVYLQVIDELILRLSTNQEDVAKCKTEVDELLYYLRKGLENVAGNKGENAKILARVEELLEPTSNAKPEMVELNEETINQEGNEEFKQFATLLTPENLDEAPPQELSKYVDSIRLLKVGNWVTLHLNPEQPERMNIAWIGEEHKQIVLVSPQGAKVLEMDLRQLAEHLRDGKAVIEDDVDLPPVDQGLYDMIQHIYKQLSHHTTHDNLTNLLNRKEFEKLLTKSLQAKETRDIPRSFAYLDLDQFKVLNNAYGHEAGDAFLKMVANCLGDKDNENLTVARLSGDEFGLLLNCTTPGDAKDFMEQKRKDIQGLRLEWHGDKLTSTASIGLVNIDLSSLEEQIQINQLFQSADAACFAAKNAGRNRTVVYEPESDELHRQEDSMALAAKVNLALEENHLKLYGQTIAPVRLDGEEKPRLEVLMTIQKQADLGINVPTFIEAAEKYNRMVDIDRWVIKTSFEWMQAHKETVHSMDHVAINLSGQSMNDEGMLDFIVDQFSTTNVETEKVCFEITETTAISNLDSAAEFVNKMKAIGCRFSLDDFGTGHASYAYLKRLPVDFLKIDGDFVRDIHTVPEDAAMVRSINEIAHYMGKRTIAEHVENDEILEMIRDIGIDYAQGYGIGKPRPLEEIQPYSV